jgi:hypothetical protein
MDQLSPLGDLGTSCKYHGIRFDLDPIPFQKWKVRHNWDFFGNWMQLLIHDLACTE